MFNKTSILLFIFIGLLTTVSLGQRSAQATMRVSVEVVKGSSIAASENGKVVLSSEETSELGSLTLEGIERNNTILNISNKISLKDSQNNEIELNVSSKMSQSESAYENITFLGGSDKEMKSGMYRGELSTTIEYL